MPRRRMIVSGRVQGVGFRYYAMREAERCGVAGWVRNRADGDVEIEAQADEAALDRFFRAVRKGPAFSRVLEVDITPMAEKESDEAFRLEW